MQTCPECGSRNEDGELFCGSCGTYLVWEETQAAVADGGVSDDAGPGPVENAGGDGTVDELAAGDTDPGDGHDVQPAALAADPASASADEAAPAAEPARDDEAPAAAAPADTPAPTGGSPVAAAPAAGVLGGLGGRAARAARRAADQATGGAVTAVSSTTSRARSEVRSVTQAPGRGAVDRATRAAGGGPLAQAAAAAAREATGPAPAGGAAAPSSAEPRTRERAAARPADAAAPALAAPTQPSPTRPAKPAPRQPAARKPGAPVQRRPVPRAEEEEPPPRPGELVCGACGAGNAPHRHFCRRCGADLADAPVQPQRSWWRRVLRPEPRSGPVAGTRPRSRRRRRFPTGLVVTLIVLGLLGAGAWYARDSLAGAYDAVVDRVAGDEPVNPAEVTASSARADRPASYVRDGIRDRSWAPEGDGIGESVELVLSEPVRLVTVLVTAGNGGEEDQRLLEARPREVRLTMTTPAGEEVQDVELTDTGEPQPVSVGLSGVERVRLTILSVYGEELGAPVALAEVELQGRG